MKRKVMAMTMALAMTVGMLSGSTVSAGGVAAVPSEINLYTYYADSSVTIIDETVKKLNEIYPDLTINIEHRTDSDGQVLKTRAAVGELPDVLECTGTVRDSLAQSGDLAELDGAMEAYGLQDKFLDGALEDWVSPDGHYYAINPINPSAFLMFYNKEVFAELNLEPPKNFDEFKMVVTALSDSGRIPLALFGQQKWPGLQLYDLAVIGCGQPLGITGLDDGVTSIEEPEYLEAAQKVQEVVSLGLIGSGALNTNASQAFELVGTGQAGMLANGSWFFDDAKNNGYADNIGYFEYNPFADAGEEIQWKNMSGGAGLNTGYAVSATGDNVEFCKQFLMDFIYIHTQVSAELGALSSLKESVAPKEPRSEAYQNLADHISDIESYTRFNFSLNNQELLVALEDETELLNTGSITAEDFISDLSDQIAELE